MGLILLLVSGVLHYLLSYKIDFWMTISALGFNSSTPLGYMKNPQGYRLLNILLGLAVVLSPLLGGTEIYFGMIGWVIIWLSSGAFGRKAAYREYRKIITEIISNTDDDDDSLEELRISAKKTDEELAEMVQRYMKYGY